MTDHPSTPDDEATALGETDTETFELEPQVHSTSNWKVLGELNAADGIGVLGHHTASSGVQSGVHGVTDSTETGAAGVRGASTASSGTTVATYGVHGVSAADGTLSVNPAGVKGQATGDGETSGVLGVTESTAGRAAGVQAMATTGSANAIFAESSGGMGIEVTTGGDSEYAVWGRNVGTTGTATAHGIVGETNTAADGVAGVVGTANDTDVNETFGVKGVTDAAGTGTGTTQPAGVKGTATSASGTTHGVQGGNYDDPTNRFELTASTGVFGDTDRPDQTGVVGTNTATSGGASWGVAGYTDSVDAPAVYAEHGGTGLAFEADGHATVQGNLSTSGHVDAGEGVRGNVGASAYLSSNQTVTANSQSTVAFDVTEADERNEFDTATGEFTCAYDGTYHVDTGINLASGPVQGDEDIQVQLSAGGTPRAIKDITIEEDAGDPTYTLSKTLFNLGSGQTISVQFDNKSGHDLEVFGSSNFWTWITIHQVG